ncbi:MAG: adenine-specific DNA-methyltransferase [Chloroflexia bacterium]|jgi:adenine-specific DNA-methyltransferase|nr:adenine-specific DNA-methyltransferase [Chloroflexia bacterium]
MRYLGNKDSLLPFIDEVLAMHGVKSTREKPLCVCDPFTGTTSVARHLKRQEWQTVTGDLMTYSYALQHAYIALNEAPVFANLVNAGVLDGSVNLPVPLHRVIAHLNNLRGVEGFFYWNYSPDGPEGRRYFTSGNALRIDAIRNTIMWWWERSWLTESERFLLTAALIEAVSRVANIAGTYAAFLKRWDSRARKPLMLAVPQVVHSAYEHRINLADANELVPNTDCDLLYVDPPYNTRQYCTNYHLLETLAVGDEPETRGVAGLRTDGDGKKSVYSKAGAAEEALSKLVTGSKAKWVLVSYNSEGVIPHDKIVDILSQRGNVEIYACEYRRFRSDADGENRQYKPNNTVQEMLYWVG